MTENEKKALQVIANFQISGNVENIKLNTQGLINTTIISTFDDDGIKKKYTHQRINKNVFKKPFEVMSNILKVTKHIAEKVKDYADADKRCLNVILTYDNKPFFVDEDGEYWRTYAFIDDVNTFNSFKNLHSVNSLGRAIGVFQKQLSDFDASSLFDTIPHFHDMKRRYTQLEDAIKNNPLDRVSLVKDEIDFLMENRKRGEMIWRDYETGILPTRVTHNDTKMNNVLFDKETDDALCVIDLDTIMPGTILFDTGDMIRTACNTGTEDEKDLRKIEFNKDIYNALISGYLEEADFLTKEERENIKESGRTITQIMAVRFLTDYIAGDVYYHTDYPEHNIVRARTQIKLIKSMDSQWDEY